MDNNMYIYEQVQHVPDTAKKTITAGRLKGMTDINPMWRIKMLTELFGPCGIGWWYVIKDKRLEPGADGSVAAIVDIDLFYVYDGALSHPIPGTGGAMFVSKELKALHTSDECFKMALTDAISVVSKALGIGADVYWEAGRTKYTAPSGEENKAQKAEAKFDDKTTIEPEKCEKCGRIIRPYTGSNGKEVGVRKHIAASKNQFEGHLFCIDCIMQMLNNENPD